MDCTLKIIAGPDTGQEFLCGTETYFGRSQRCLVRLSSPDISFEHVLLTRQGDDFFVENLSANGTLFNGQRLLAKTRLRLKDQLQLGVTLLRVEKLPAAQAASANRRWLLIALLAVFMFSAVAVVYFSDTSSAPPATVPVYRLFYDFAKDKVQHEKMPPEVTTLLDQAWRLDSSGNHAEAMKSWATIDVLLDDWDRKQGHRDDLSSTRNLRDLQSGKVKSLPDDDMRIAFKQWVTQMERPRAN